MLLISNIIDITNFIVETLDNGNILLKKIPCITITKLRNIKNYNWTKSTILECYIQNKLFAKFKYNSILEKIYEIIGCGTTTIKNTKLNIKTIKKETEGFFYINSLGISLQRVDSNKNIYKIVSQSIENNISIKIKIKLKNKTIINVIF